MTKWEVTIAGKTHIINGHDLEDAVYEARRLYKLDRTDFPYGIERLRLIKTYEYKVRIWLREQQFDLTVLLQKNDIEAAVTEALKVLNLTETFKIWEVTGISIGLIERN